MPNNPARDLTFQWRPVSFPKWGRGEAAFFAVIWDGVPKSALRNSVLSAPPDSEFGIGQGVGDLGGQEHSDNLGSGRIQKFSTVNRPQGGLC